MKMSKHYQKIIIVLSVIGLLVLLSTCGPVPFDRMGLLTISVDFIGESSGNAKYITSLSSRTLSYQIEPVISEDFYKATLQSVSRGSLRNSYTPVNFILNIVS